MAQVKLSQPAGHGAARSLSDRWHSQQLMQLQVKGATENLIDLVKALQPSIVIPLINAEFNQSGPLSWFIRPKGSVEELEQRLRNAGLQKSRVQMPAAPGHAFAVDLT